MAASKKKVQERRRKPVAAAPEHHGVRAHPVQGRRPHDPRRVPYETYEAGPLNPLAYVPGIFSPHVAGSTGLVFGGRHLPGGPFVGVSPRGYARSDQRILEDVCDRLTEHGELDVHDVTVEVKDGEVTLEGHVPNRFTKRVCERVAEDVVGVQDVHNRLVLAG